MNRLLTSVVVGLAGIQGFTLAAESRPKLVVGIVVDQLRSDYLEDLQPLLSTGGFRRLMEQALYLRDVEFKNLPSDAAAASAVIQTGAYPRFNGVTGEFVFDDATKSYRNIFADDAYIGNFTSEKYSPAALKVTTITDQLSIEEQGNPVIHSIAPDAAQAIILAGHSGNSAFWINDETGNWASSTFYPNPPATLQNLNYSSPLVSRLDTMKWTPLRKAEPYPFVSSKEIQQGFKYSFSRSDRDVFNHYKLSPFINSDISKAASQYVSQLNLGKNDHTDVLNLAFSLAPYPLAGEDNYRYELEDAYLRLDRELEQLLDTFDRLVGKDNVLVYLVSTGYFTEPTVENENYRLPGGTFSVKRAMALLNALLSARYGNAPYVDHFSNGQIFLSKSVLEEKNLHLEDIARESRDFLVRMSGVADAFTLSDLSASQNPAMEARRLASDPKTAGDIFLEFSPGWKIIDDSRFPPFTQDNKVTLYPFPAFIMAPGVSPKVVTQPVEATQIAPTIAGALRIRPPTAASSKGLN